MALLLKRLFMRKISFPLELFISTDIKSNYSSFRRFHTHFQKNNFKSTFKVSIFGLGIGTVLGAGYAFKKINDARQNLALEGTIIENKALNYIPEIKISRKVISSSDRSGLKLTLYQYQTCPFCCKVRVLLDYYGFSYDIVEVDPVLKNELSWSDYKKVPIVLIKTNEGFQPLHDSTLIVSILSSYLYDKSHNIQELTKYYPVVAVHDNDGVFKHDIINKYFIMYQSSLPGDRDLNSIVEERKWRKWADDILVHTLSPNVYRTLGESLQTFNWFCEIGNWKEYFPYWERAIMVYVGAIAMWLISKKLKRKHNLKDDARESFYDEINVWLQAVQSRGGKFMGGMNPDLSDLAVYGVLKSIEGCEAFKDALKNTKLTIWFNAMKEKVDSHAGSDSLKNF